MKSLILNKIDLVEIKYLQAEAKVDFKKWDDYVFNSSDGTFFHRSGWFNVIKNVFNHDVYYIYVEINGEIKGILPLGHVNSFLFGNSLSSLPFAVYGGIVSSSNEASDYLLAEAKKLSISLGVSHLELRNIENKSIDWPRQSLYVTFRKEIFESADENMQAIPRKQRAMVRKGIKNSLTSIIEFNVNNFFKLYSDNVHRHGTPAFPKFYFEYLLSEFKENCEILTVLNSDNIPVSSVFVFYFKDEVMPYYAGDSVEARDIAANDFKYWDLLRRSCEKGIKIFDFGRSKVGTGSFSFKKNWGFEPTQLNYEYLLINSKEIPQNNPLNSKFSIVIKIWKMLPRSIVNMVGPYIVRNLG